MFQPFHSMFKTICVTTISPHNILTTTRSVFEAQQEPNTWVPTSWSKPCWCRSHAMHILCCPCQSYSDSCRGVKDSLCGHSMGEQRFVLKQGRSMTNDLINYQVLRSGNTWALTSYPKQLPVVRKNEVLVSCPMIAWASWSISYSPWHEHNAATPTTTYNIYLATCSPLVWRHITWTPNHPPQLR